MIDKISCRIQGYDSRQLSEHMKLITAQKNLINDKIWCYYSYNDLKFKFNQNEVLSFEFSLQKFLLNQNSSCFTFDLVEKAVDYLTKILDVGMNEIEVYSAEFGINIPLDRPVNDYLENVFVKKDFDDFVYGNFSNTIYYKGKDYTIVIYDKSKESNLNQNILRY